MKNRMRSRGSKPLWVKALALERIEALMALAKSMAGERPERAKRYVELALRLSSRYNVSVPARWKRKFCKRCFAWWTTGGNVKVRARNGVLTYRCTECSAVRRVGYK
ncbi:ribonuclease P [archaeon]|nr:ribonuclease P [archaeon]